MRAIVVVIALLVASSHAHADDTKSPGWALGLSVGGTVGGTLLLGSMAGDSEAPPSLLLTGALAMVTGPSWGHIYTGDYDLAVGGTLLRVVGFAMVKEGMGDCVASDDPYADLDDCEYENKKPGLAAAGTVIVIGAALAEIVDAPLAAKRHNRDLALTPITTARGGYGLALSGTF